MLAVYLTAFFICVMFFFGFIVFTRFLLNRDRDFAICAVGLFAIDAVMLIAGLHFGLD